MVPEVRKEIIETLLEKDQIVKNLQNELEKNNVEIKNLQVADKNIKAKTSELRDDLKLKVEQTKQDKTTFDNIKLEKDKIIQNLEKKIESKNNETKNLKTTIKNIEASEIKLKDDLKIKVDQLKKKNKTLDETKSKLGTANLEIETLNSNFINKSKIYEK